MYESKGIFFISWIGKTDKNFPSSLSIKISKGHVMGFFSQIIPREDIEL